jgi:hypothetical protein
MAASLFKKRAREDCKVASKGKVFLDFFLEQSAVEWQSVLRFNFLSFMGLGQVTSPVAPTPEQQQKFGSLFAIFFVLFRI